MVEFFLKLVNMSISASWLILAVILFRLLFHKAPKRFRMIMWAVVAVSLICPFRVESVLSLIPSSNTITYDTIAYEQAPAIHSGFESVDDMINPVMGETLVNQEAESASPALLVTYGAMYLWLAIAAVLILYGIISYIQLRKRVASSITVQEHVKLCDHINTPFILGIFSPTIYLPSDITEEYKAYVLQHEKAHIKRLDYLWKPIAYILLILYCFQPFVWVAFILFCRDLEMSCDEKVIASMELDEKKVYSTALLSLSTGKPFLGACPLAFGETGVKTRIKQILSYKKPTLWVIIVAAVLCIILAVCFLTNPKSTNTTPEANQVDAGNLTGNLTEQSANEQTNQTDLPTTGSRKTDLEIQAYLQAFSGDTDALAKEGCFVISGTGQIVGGLELWNSFCTSLNEQKEAELMLAQFTAEGDAILDYLYYDGSQITHACDSSRDAYRGDGEAFYVEIFPYMKVFDETLENGDMTKAVVLTNEADLTADIWWNRLISSTVMEDTQSHRSRFLAYITLGNTNAEVTGEENWHQVAYSFDMGTVLLPKEDITYIEVINGNTGASKTFSVLDGSPAFGEILDLYEALNAAPNADLENRSGYAYSMCLMDSEKNILQRVTPYKDAVSFNWKIYDCSQNGTSTQLLLYLDALDW